MDVKSFIRAFLLTVLATASVIAVAREPQELMWDDMIPFKKDKVQSALRNPDKDPGPLIEEDPYAYLDFTQPVEELNGRYVKVPGFVVPLESDEGGLLSEFLLVPYFGACIHVPPPPPNQIIYVTLDKPVEIYDTWNPFWIIGTITTKPYMGEVANTVYQLAGERMEDYEE